MFYVSQYLIIDDAEKVTNELHDTRTLEIAPAQQKEKILQRAPVWCRANTVGGQVRTSHNSKVLERGQLCVLWFMRVLGLFIVVKG